MHALALAARQRGQAAMGPRQRPGGHHGAIHRRLVLRLPMREPAAVCEAPEADHFGGGEIGGARALRQPCEPSRALATRPGGEGSALQADGARARGLEAGERSQQRRFAAAVRTDDAGPAPQLQIEGDALQHHMRAVTHVKVVAGQRGARLVPARGDASHRARLSHGGCGATAGRSSRFRRCKR